jgi:hypothetical protein
VLSMTRFISEPGLTYKGDIESESRAGCRWNHFFYRAA